MFKQKKIFFLPIALLIFGGIFSADVRSKADDERQRAEKAAAVFAEIMKAPDYQIPKTLLEKARAIAVIPHVVKGAFIVGGKWGKGLVAQRNNDGSWSAPSYIELSGASIGFQIGASATDYILVFTNSEGLEPLLNGKVKLGADASVAAGPVGRTASADTDITLNSAIYSYSRSKGVFAGVALDGAVVSTDDSANNAAYGGEYSAKAILFGNAVSTNQITEVFHKALKTHMPAS
jgi:lipid-binding SYLF domain-containing protein